MFTALGITSVQRKLLLTFASAIVSCSGAVIGSATNDWIKRRHRYEYSFFPTLICTLSKFLNRFAIGSFFLAAALSLVAAMSSFVAASQAREELPSAAISGLGIFGIFLFGWIFAFVYTPNQSLYCTEVTNQEIRAKGISLHSLQSNLVTILFTYTTSIALGTISWKYYFVWIAVDIISGVLWWFLGVEVVGRTIEELDKIFEAPFPPKASWTLKKIVRTDEGKFAVQGLEGDAEALEGEVKT